VSIPTLRLTATQQAECQRVADALPSSVAGQGRRKTQPAAALGAAWGDPAIIAQCGVGVPQGFSRTASCQQVNGVGWFVPDDQVNDPHADVVMATVGYRPIVQVTVPATYRPSGLAAAEVQIGAVVKKYTTLVHACH
jgi:hypothetical protein